MEVLVHKEGRIAFLLRKRMAFVTSSFRVEQLPAALSRVTDRVLVASHEAIERGVEGKLCALIRCDGADQIASVNGAPEHTLKLLLIFRHSRNPRDSSIHAGLTHFARINDRKSRLLLEGFCMPVPKLRDVVESVENRRRIALPGAAFDADRNGPAVSERERWIVACTA